MLNVCNGNFLQYKCFSVAGSIWKTKKERMKKGKDKWGKEQAKEQKRKE